MKSLRHPKQFHRILKADVDPLLSNLLVSARRVAKNCRDTIAEAYQSLRF